MKTLTGKVVSTSSKTASVAIETKSQHPLYKKTVKKTKKFLVHDEVGVKIGDTVTITSSRPISKNKHWKIITPTNVKPLNKTQK